MILDRNSWQATPISLLFETTTVLSDPITMLFLRCLSFIPANSFKDREPARPTRRSFLVLALTGIHVIQDRLLAITSSLDHSKCNNNLDHSKCNRSSGQGHPSLRIIGNGSMPHWCRHLNVSGSLFSHITYWLTTWQMITGSNSTLIYPAICWTGIGAEEVYVLSLDYGQLTLCAFRRLIDSKT